MTALEVPARGRELSHAEVWLQDAENEYLRAIGAKLTAALNARLDLATAKMHHNERSRPVANKKAALAARTRSLQTAYDHAQNHFKVAWGLLQNKGHTVKAVAEALDAWELYDSLVHTTAELKLALEAPLMRMPTTSEIMKATKAA